MSCFLTFFFFFFFSRVNGSDANQVISLNRARSLYFGENSSDSELAREVAHASRYIDNEELRFSMRSLHAFAPWVRYVFLVTNGQIPHWLDLSHPQLRIVRHEDIFANSSHLPTFSSPAIEANLHRIPGLAKRFIYLNDDVMFGRPVYPSDFITPSHGQKVFLAWACPNCNEGCPPNWIADGYCDIQCNVSACDWDGGDCANQTAPGVGGGANGQQHAFNHYAPPHGNWYQPMAHAQYCSRGCPSSWIGDKYCDRACKSAECGFDAGDCGIELLVEGLHGVQVSLETSLVELPEGCAAAFLNLTGVVGDGRITDGSHDKENTIRTATISQKEKIMTLTMFNNVSRTTATVHLEWEDVGNVHRNMSFALLVGGEAPTTTVTTTTESSTTPPSSSSSEPTTTPVVLARKLLAYDGTLEAENEVPPKEGVDTSLPLHPMGLGERVGTSIYPWQRDLPLQGTSRRLLDVYADSLKHVNALYNRRYGSDARKVPAHMPHFIQLDVLQRLHDTFPEEWERTSSHPFRSSTDMQFAFAYFYFLINERQTNVWPRYFHTHIDTNQDGQLCSNEFRTAWAMVHDTPLDEGAIERTFNTLTVNATIPLTLDRLEQVQPDLIFDKLKKYLEKLPRNGHEVKDTDEVGFVMIRNNDTSLQGRLDGIRRKRHKHICLNDNLHHDSPDTLKVKRVVHDFYMSILPLPSPFEKQDKYVRTDALFLWILVILSLMAFCFWLSLLARRRSNKRD